MESEYMIQIRGIQNFHNGDKPDVVELCSLGKFVKKGTSYYISYEETEATGFGGTTTTLKIETPPRVTMMRSTGKQTHLIIEKDKRHLCQYDTGAGCLMVGVSTGDIQIDVYKRQHFMWNNFSIQ